MGNRYLPRRRRKALEDIAEYAELISSDSLRSGLLFLDAVEKTVMQICDNPESGGAIPTKSEGTGLLRAKLIDGFKAYAILYVVDSEFIDVLRIVRGGQDIESVAW